MKFSARAKTIAAPVLLILLAAFVGWPIYNTGAVSIRHEEVKIRSGDALLAATISSPRWGTGPFPAIVSVHGSGRIRRQDISSDWRKLVPEGIVVLTFDKRGVGESTGRFEELTVERSEERLGILAADVLACFDHLKKLPQVDAKRIGLFGGSQAGWVIPVAADKQPEIAFCIVMAGAATSCGLETYYSALTGDGHRPVERLSDEEIDRRLERYDGLHGFDPIPVLARTRIPNFWLIGARDLSTPARQSIRNLEKLKSEGAPITIKVYPNGDHGLRDVTTGRNLPYWQDLVQWMRERQIITTTGK